jgi:hypothetical protein
LDKTLFPGHSQAVRRPVALFHFKVVRGTKDIPIMESDFHFDANKTYFGFWQTQAIEVSRSRKNPD